MNQIELYLRKKAAPAGMMFYTDRRDRNQPPPDEEEHPEYEQLAHAVAFSPLLSTKEDGASGGSPGSDADSDKKVTN